MSDAYPRQPPALLRPSLSGGSYPERPQSPTGWFAATVHSLAGIAAGAGISWRRLGRDVAAIERQAALLMRLSDARLATRVSAIRLALHRQGLQDDLVNQAFALVRETAGRTIGMRHHNCQLLGGLIMVHGGLAEMETGEGKTFTATLAAATAALAGIPVHIITVNDYLVSRDAQLMGPLYSALGLSVGAVTEDMDVPARRAAYACHITYCTNKQLTFDYLRDRLLLGSDHGRIRLQLERLHTDAVRNDSLFLRGLCFAIVDEADSVLIDEARTPLIITRSVINNEEQQTYQQALSLAAELEMHRDFALNRVDRQAELLDEGQAHLLRKAQEIGGVWNGERRRTELICMALAALHLYSRDRHYLIKDGKVLIIDENTGRTMADRSWERGLHQMIEIKEGCEMSGQRENLARITYQRFFSRYLRLAGMTGTASEVRRELWSVYHLPVVKVPTHRPCLRTAAPPRIYPDKQSKWAGIVEQIATLHVRERPVLVGTRSVADSELLSELLHARGITHQVLNARELVREAEIVARAGKKQSVTVATNMAGRGTDIPLDRGVAELGGLHVIVAESNEAKRIDRQLYGRCGRQGDPGSYQRMLSLEDELIVHSLGEPFRRVLYFLIRRNSPLANTVGLWAMRMAQSTRERHHLRNRRNLLQQEEQLGRLLAFSGRRE